MFRLTIEVNFDEVLRVQLAKPILLTSMLQRAGVPGIFSHLLRSVHMLKREWGAESNGKLPHLFILSKITTLVPEFKVEDLPSGITAALMSEFAVKDLPSTHSRVKSVLLLSNIVIYHQNYHEFTNITKLPKLTYYILISYYILLARCNHTVCLFGIYF